MAWRFKASKYKNAAPIVPKPENCIRDITVGSYQTYGHNIVASAAFMAFNMGQTGASLGVLPLEDVGRKGKDMALLHGHSDTITDMSFSPFHDGLLATGSQDCLIKIWCIPEGGLETSLTEPECVLYSKTQRRVETVLFHPIADCLLTTSSWCVLNLWDITSHQCIYSNGDEHGEVIQCIAWSGNGTQLATTCKDKLLRIFDVRAGSPVVGSTNSHQGMKDSRVVWLNDNQRLLTTGFNATRQREIVIRDLRKLSTPVKSIELDSSTGILLPLYDPDTNMLFLAGKGDTSIQYMEVIDRDPFLVEGLRHTGEQTKGANLVSKRALHVMQGEVNRVLQLTSSSVIPIMYQVPRKTYRDFHADLYPETAGCVSDVTANEWMTGINGTLHKISLDPSKNTADNLVSHRGSLKQLAMELDVRSRARPTNGEASDPPKPRPRSSRSNSVELTDDRPVARPRTSRGSDANDKDHRLWQKEINDSPISRRTTIECEEGAVLTNVRSSERDKENRPCWVKDSAEISEPPETNQTQNETQKDQGSCAPVLRRAMSDVNEGRSHPQQDVQDQDRAIIHSVNPHLPISGGYKPRLGPKPFTPPKLTNYVDKGIIPTSLDFEKPTFTSQNNDLACLNENSKDYEKDTLELHNLQNVTKIENDLERPLKKDLNTQVLNNEDSPVRNGDNGIPKTPPKTPSLADRKKMFEDKPDEVDEGLERGTPQRNSIAERRRVYENRSVSVQEERTSPTPLRRKGSGKGRGDVKEEVAPAPKRTSTVFGRVSKFRHLKATPMHKSSHIENIRNVSRQVSGECDGLHANCERVAIPLSGPGGKIAVLELSRTGRLPDGVIPSLVHGNNVMDFCWDPFDNKRLAVSCDDGIVRLWMIPSAGLSEPSNEPNTILESHSDKVHCIKFHPLAKDVLATASYDMTIRIWDLQDLKLHLTLTGHEDQILCMAWSPCGKMLATACKDGVLRIYDPRKSSTPIKQGKGPSGTRGARLIWALDGTFIVVMGFDKVSERQVSAYDSNQLQLLNTVGLDVSPATLIPFYDEDSSTLFLTGRGDTTIYTFEISEEPPHICPLSHHRCSTLHQGLGFLPKNVCDVTTVEFARAMRLTNNTIEPLSFTVPRIKSELFQDDLFPPTKITWEPTMTGKEWFSGSNKPTKRISLQPPGMEALSSVGGGDKGDKNSASRGTAPSLAAVQAAFGTNSPEMLDYTKNKQEQLQKAVSSRLEMNLSLEQDKMEGVDEVEWDE